MKEHIDIRINRAKELTNRAKELLKQKENQEYIINYVGVDFDEDEYYDNDDIDDGPFVVDENQYDTTIFSGTGWSRCDLICIKRLYIEDDTLMFDFYNFIYYPWPREFDGPEKIEWWSSDRIIGRFSDFFEPDYYNHALEKIIKWMENSSC